MKNKFIILLCLLIFSTITLSFDLSVDELSMNVTIEEPYSKCISVTNNYNETHYNISMTNFVHEKIDVLSKGQTKDLCFNITRVSTGTVTFNPIVYGYYKQNYTLDPENYVINLDDINNNTIKEGDTIQFCNTDSQTHTIMEMNGAWTKQVNANSCVSVDEITYTQEIRDMTSNQIGVINVVSNIGEVQVRENDYDAQFVLTINSFLPISTLELVSLIPDFKVDHNGTVRGASKIINGNIDLDDVTLSMPWAEFEENNFYLEANETKVITYDITPNLDEEEGGTCHNLTLSAGMEGYKTVTNNIEVCINSVYNSELDANGSKIIVREMTDKEKIAYFKTDVGLDIINWYCFEYNGTQESCIRTKTIIQNADLNETINARFNELKAMQEVEQNSLNRIETVGLKTLSEQQDELNNEFVSYKNTSGKTIDATAEYIISQDKTGNGFWTFIFVLIFIVVVLIFARLIIKVKNKREDDDLE